MKKYKVIQGLQKDSYKPTATIYTDALIKLIAKEERIIEESVTTDKALKQLYPDMFFKKLYMMVIAINSGYCDTQIYPPEMWEDWFFMTESINSMISHMTPLEFQRIFPVAKTYDGNRYHIIDYFHTKKIIMSIGENVTIGKNNMMYFIQNYCNKDIGVYLMNMESIRHHVWKYRNGKDFMSEIAEEILCDSDLSSFNQHKEQHSDKHKVSRRNRRIFKIMN